MPIERPSRARGAQLSAQEDSVEAPTQFVKVPASEVQIGDLIVFDQQPKASEVVAISEETHGEIAVRRFTSLDAIWLVQADHEVRKAQ